MPYVEVWVDDADIQCHGSCDKSQELIKRRDSAFALMIEGDVNAAIDVLTRGQIPEARDMKAMQKKYEAWSKGNLDGFAGPASLTENNPTSKESKDA